MPPRKILRPTFVEPSAARSAPRRAARDEQARALGLRRAGLGYVYDGSQGERFKAQILRDGTVEFDVEPQVQLTVDGVCLLAVCKQTKAGHKEVKRRKRTTGLMRALGVALAEGAIMSAGSGPRWYGQPTSGPIEGAQVTGPRSVNTAAVQGRYGFLPTPLTAMSQFMDRTFALRVELAQESAREDLERARKQLPQTLGALWADASLSVGDRKARVLSLWDEFDPGADHIDLAVAQSIRGPLSVARSQGAVEGRQKIVDSVRLHLPEGSAAAFTDTELDLFNGRSEAGLAFRPYDADPRIAVDRPAGPSDGD